MCCSYDNVLEVQRLYRDAGLSDLEKADQALVMLTGSPFRLWLMGEGDKIQLLNKIYEEQIRIPKKPSVGKQIRSLEAVCGIVPRTDQQDQDQGDHADPRNGCPGA